MFSCNFFTRKSAFGATILLVLAFVILVSAGALAQTAIPPAAGDGSKNNPYQITQLGNLVWLHNQAAANQWSTINYYALMNDIDASDTANWNDNGTSTDVLEGFNPIGVNYQFAFKGVFYGNNHKITGLVINRPGTDYVALFGHLSGLAQVKDLGLVDCSIKGKSFVGGLTGYNYTGLVSNCYVSGSISATDINSYVGGLVGYQTVATVTDCYTTVTVSSTGYFVGGLMGNNTDTGTIKNCHSSGHVTGSVNNVGGLVGYTEGTITNCYSRAVVDGQDNIGGLAGACRGTITDCYATGAVTGQNTVGGLAGWSYNAEITNAYTTGAVTGVGNIGGLVGYINTSVISQCYSIGAVSGSNSYIGGLVGWNDNISSVTLSYWNNETSGQSTSAGGTGETTIKMKQMATYVDWDTTSTWGINGAYLFLQNFETSTITYMAGEHGLVGDGLTTGTTLIQTVNIGASGTAVTAVPNTDYKFAHWSDGLGKNPRTDTNISTNTSVMAEYALIGPPTVTSAAAVTYNTKPTWTWTSAGGVGSYRYQLDAEVNGAWIDTTETEYTPAAELAMGVHTLYVQEMDSDGNWSASGSFTVTIKLGSPGVSWELR